MKLKEGDKKQELYPEIDENFMSRYCFHISSHLNNKIRRCAFEGVYGLARFGKQIPEI